MSRLLKISAVFAMIVSTLFLIAPALATTSTRTAAVAQPR